jgi:Dolichyl-phosphate-mannose-protein mannosyltransferase
MGFTLIEGVSNFDGHHPGLMFSPAIDLKHGLKPSKEVAILYGYLTTYFQSLSFYVFGENLLSIWITTGIFYACSLWLFYRIFQFLMSSWLAFLTVLLIFLVHPYSVYPWSNYYSCAFNLLAVLLLANTLSDQSPAITRRTTLSQRDAFFSSLVGLAMGGAILCRYSAIISICPPPIIFFALEFCWSEKATRQQRLKQGVLILFGALSTFLMFAAYCLYAGVWNDFLAENQVVSKVWQSYFLGTLGYRDGSVSLFFLGSLLKNIYAFAFQENLRLSIFSIIFLLMVTFSSFYVLLKFLDLYRFKKKGNSGSSQSFRLNNGDRVAFFLSLSSIFAYANSIHLYESFRLVNGAAIGFGVVTYLAFVRMPEWCDMRQHFRGFYRLIMLALLTLLATCLLKNLLPINNKLQWESLDMAKIVQWRGNQIPSKVFAHQILPLFVEEHYTKFSEVLEKFDDSYIIVNNTNDTLLNIVSDKRKAYLLPALLISGFWEKIGDLERGRQAIASGKALIITYNTLDIPEGYHEILRRRTLGMPLDSTDPNIFTVVLAKVGAKRIAP